MADLFQIITDDGFVFGMILLHTTWIRSNSWHSVMGMVYSLNICFFFDVCVCVCSEREREREDIAKEENQ